MSDSNPSPAPVGGHETILLPGRHRLAPFADAVRANGTLYLSGRLGLDPVTGVIPDSPEEESHLLLDDVAQVLTSAGMTMDDLVYVQIFCSDLSLFEHFNRIYRGYFRDYVPARAFIGSGPLLRGARFEVCAVAVKRG